MKILLVILCLSIGLAGCSSQTQPKAETISLTEGWVLEGFSAPESIIPDGQNGYFVSNVNGEGGEKDGNGFISRISSNGKLIEQKWASGLDAPKGMAIFQGTLYVTDIDKLVLIDVKTGNVSDAIPIEGAVFLNDVAAGEKGVFVSDSGRAKIHYLEDETLPVWLEDERLGGINGLHIQDKRLLISTMSEGELLSVDWETRSLSTLASGMKNADGLNERADGSFIVSSWPGQIWHVQPGKAAMVLLDTRNEPAVYQNDILVETNRILAPNWQPGTVREYKISSQE